MSKKITKNIFVRTMYLLWYLFLNGLFTILPITLTIALFNASFQIIVRWLDPVHRLVKSTIFGTIPYAEVILTIAIILMIGIIMKVLLLRTIVHAIEGLFFKIPLIRPIYSGIKQLVHAFGVQDKMTFKHVVMVEFPRNDVYSVGFMTSELPASISPKSGKKFYNIFIPTTPNPTSGFLIQLSEQNIRIIDLTRQEAMALIISGGIITPERFTKSE
ncbi:MAG: DUF502 domain-containing protein [bacterium]|nr:DUF502 domain-containing protein [bacterium]